MTSPTPYVTMLGGALAAYLVTSVLYVGYAFLQREWLHRRGRQALWVAVTFHGLALLFRGVAAWETPLRSPIEATSLFTAGVALVFLLLTRNYPLHIGGALLAPFNFLMCVCSLINSHHDLTPPTPISRYWLAIHVPVIVLAFIGFGLSALAGLAYLVQEQLLKRRVLRPLQRILPPLDVSDQLVYKLVVYGFPLMSLGMITGVLWAMVEPTTMQLDRDPRVLLVSVSWVCYAAYLVARRVSGWRGRRPAVLIVAAFLCVMVAFVGFQHHL